MAGCPPAFQKASSLCSLASGRRVHRQSLWKFDSLSPFVRLPAFWHNIRVAIPREAEDPEFVRRVQQQVSLLSRKGWYHSIELRDGTIVPGLISVETLRARLASFPIPDD